MKKFLAIFLLPFAVFGATTNDLGNLVLINDAGDTQPAQSIATPGQVSSATSTAESTLAEAQALQGLAAEALATANAALSRIDQYSTNYVVTSTVYVQSIGGVPYDPSNQTIRVWSFSAVSTNVIIVGTVRQVPLIPPSLDWRQQLNTGAWSNITAVVAQVDLPAGETNAVRAYSFTLPKPHDTQAFFRVVDNSTGASGSGLYWMVFGGITVDGRAGANCTITNIVGAVTNRYPVVGGIIVNPTPL